MFEGGMTNEQFNAHLELLAKLIEMSAKTVEEAAQIVRDAKVGGQKEKKKPASRLSFDTENLAFPEVRVGKKSMDG